jgi:glycosyltransferase involved in cell wall biosynthesis
MDTQKGIKILHVLDSSGLYGAEMMVLSLMDEQQSFGDHPILCSIGTANDDEKEIERAAEQQGHSLIRMRMARGFNLRGAYAMLRLAHRYNVDLIHSHGYRGNILLGTFTRKLRRLPMVSTLHGWTSTGKFSKMHLYEWLDCLSMNGVDAVITVNNEVRNGSKFGWCFNRRVSCIPNGIPDFSADTPSLCPDDPIVDFCNGHFVVGALGRLSAEKGFDLLIHAFHRLHIMVPNARLVIIGEGIERSSLEILIRQLGMEDNVIMPGFKPQARQYLPLFSCLGISSLTEGLPISLLEAMMTGTPIVSTDVGGIAEALDGENAGILVKAGDVDGLFEAIQSIYRNPLLAAQKAMAAKQIAESKYSAKTMALAYRSVYAELLRHYDKTEGML